MDVSIICPIYNGEKYIENLNQSLIMQENVTFDILYILTRCSDNSEEILKKNRLNYEVVELEEFSHSLTREKAAFKANGKVVVFITQDIIIKDSKWLYKLTKDILAGECEASFSRQICDNKSIERYTRMINYPAESRIASLENLKDLGIMAYFYSDAASAINKSVFIKLNGYDQKKLLTNEDMYIAYKIINNGYRIKYCSDSEVIHSHEYSYKSLFKRYFDQGVFLKQHEYIKNSGDKSSAIKLLKVTCIKSLQEINIKAFLSIIPNFAVRFIANKLGNRYETLSKEKVVKYSSNKAYWDKYYRKSRDEIKNGEN